MINLIKTAPTLKPLGLADVKRHLNIEIGWTEDDTYLDVLIAVATEKVEQFTRRRLVSQTWYSYLDAWPSENYITLPFGQLQSVTGITYTTSANTATTSFTDASLSTTDDFDVDIKSDPGRIILEYGDSWPSETLWPMNPIQIEFVCGYGGAAATAAASVAAVPTMIKHAMRLIISDLYEIRGTEIEGMPIQKLKTVEALLTPYKLWLP